MNLLYILLLLTIFIIIGIIFSILIVQYYYPNNKLNIINFQSIYKDNSKNLKNCPKGCIRGVCSNKSNNNSSQYCKYDFNCNYCNDVDTENYYLDTVSNPKLTQKYNSIQQELNENNINDINKKIKEQNIYINKLNQQIKKMNIQV